MASLLIKRGTRAQIEAAKTASGLVAGELYLITDENRIAVGTAANAYADFISTTNLKDTPELAYDETNNTLIISSASTAGAARERLKLINTATDTSNTCIFTILSGASTGNNLQITQYGTEYTVVPAFAGKSAIQAIGANLILRSSSASTDIEFIPAGTTIRAILKASGNFLIASTTDNTVDKLQVTGSASISGGVNVSTGQTYKINNVDAVTPGLVAARLNSVPINYITGRYYDQATRCTSSGSIIGVAGQLTLSPMMVPVNLAVDRMGVNIATQVASAVGRCVVYSADELGRPSTRVLYGSDDLDFGSTGLKEHTVTFTFQAGILYWVGLHHSSTATVYGIPIASLCNLGLSAGNATNYQTCIRQTITYSSGAPATFTFAAANLISGVIVPSIRFRAA